MWKLSVKQEFCYRVESVNRFNVREILFEDSFEWTIEYIKRSIYCPHSIPNIPTSSIYKSVFIRFFAAFFIIFSSWKSHFIWKFISIFWSIHTEMFSNRLSISRFLFMIDPVGKSELKRSTYWQYYRWFLQFFLISEILTFSSQFIWIFHLWTIVSSDAKCQSISKLSFVDWDLIGSFGYLFDKVDLWKW